MLRLVQTVTGAVFLAGIAVSAGKTAAMGFYEGLPSVKMGIMVMGVRPTGF
jgi:hypothetical protein